MIKQLQIYISKCLDPYENLATEKYLLDTTPEDCCTLYLWQNQSTVVIGRNQNPWVECRCSLLESEGGKLARRLSGGGAVFHDLGNLNFTFLCSTKNYNLEKHIQVIQKACELAGITTEISGRNDILADGRKFSGNAFYNSKGKSYHHGTILVSANMERMQRYLTPSKAKLESKGVKSVKSRVINLSELSLDLTCEKMKHHMINALEKVYGMNAIECTHINIDEISRLAEEYGSWDYLYGSPIPFSFSCEERFSWGNVQLQLQVSGGIIQAVKVYTDSMEWDLPDRIQTALTNCRFDADSMSKSISKRLPQNIAGDFINLLNKQEI